MNGKVIGIFIAPKARMPMVELKEVIAVEGRGLQGDRYCLGAGSYNRGFAGKRQVSLVNAKFFRDSGFAFSECRRNIIVEGTELMYLIGKHFQVGDAILKGVKYCEPCDVPSNLLSKPASFRDVFHDVGGILADVIEEGLIRRGDIVIPPQKNY